MIIGEIDKAMPIIIGNVMSAIPKVKTYLLLNIPVMLEADMPELYAHHNLHQSLVPSFAGRIVGLIPKSEKSTYRIGSL